MSFWRNSNFRWVRKRKGGTWYKVGSYLDAAAGHKYWINRQRFGHEIYLYDVEIYR